MILLKLCCHTLPRLLVVMFLTSLLIVTPALCKETEDSLAFIAGFNAYQQKNYASSIEKMNEVLQKFPDTPLRDMALFWLSRSYYKVGNQQEAARYLSQFSKEYPDNPLKNTVEDELLTLTARFEKGEKLPVGVPPVKQPDRLAALKAEEAKQAAAAKVERERIARETAEREKAEMQRVADLKAEEARQVAAAVESARVAAAKAEQERIAREAAEREKAEMQRVADLKAEEAKQVAAAVESARVAAAKAEQERIAREAAEREKAEMQRFADLKVEEAKQVAAAVEAARVAAAKAEQERIARETAERENAETQRVADLKAEVAKQVAAAIESARAAAAKAEQERIARETAERENAETQRVADLKAEEARKVTQQIRLAALTAERELLAAAKAEEFKLAVAVAAEEKKEQERLAVYKAEQNRLAALKMDEESRLASLNPAGETGEASKRTYREKAISEYKSIIDRYPASTAAATAAVKLRELGVTNALPPKVVEAPQPENAQVLRFEVTQFAAFEFNLLTRPEVFNVGRQILVPFEVTNRGNGIDSFYLESAFPTDFNARFTSVTGSGGAINQTPELAPGETFKGSLSLVIPPTTTDGLRIAHPVKAASRLAAEASQSREIKIIASSPLLRAILLTEKTRPLPGDKILYRIAIRNAGSDAAEDVTFRLNFPPQLEPLDYVAAGFRQEMKSALVLDGMKVKSGENREFTMVFRLKDDSLAGQELVTRAELINNTLKTTAAFVANTAYVEPQRRILVRTGSEHLVAFPGQTITAPFVVSNMGNIREKYKIVSAVSGSQDAVIFHDTNRDGIRQATEPVITEIGPLAPHEEASVVVEIKTAKRAIDGSHDSVKVSFISEGDSSSVVSGLTQLTYSRPVLQMVMSGRDGQLKPGDLTSFDLVITNQGSNLARIVELQSVWPEQLELMAADPSTSAVVNGAIIWRFKELGAGEKRNIRISFRVKAGVGVGTAIQVKNILTYEDRLGNRY